MKMEKIVQLQWEPRGISGLNSSAFPGCLFQLEVTKH